MKKYYCPDCGEELQAMCSCGAEAYHCNKCKVSKSRKRIKGHPHYVEQEAIESSEKKEGG